MLSWIIITILAHFLNAVVLIIDKHLVSNTVLRPVAYAFYSSISQILFLAAIPIFGFTFPETSYLIFGVSIGVLFVLALLVFYKAIKLSEASRVIPIVGGSIPIFTFCLSYLFLNERLIFEQIIAFVLFVFGGLLMSSKFEKGKHIIIYRFLTDLFFCNLAGF